MSDSTPLLVAQDLSVRAGGREIIAPTSFAFAEGERVLVVGRSGSGKSLFVNLLLGFMGPDTPGLDVAGSLRLEGTELLGAPPEAHDGRVGAVFQLNSLGLFDDLDVAQNLRFGSAEKSRQEHARSALQITHVPRRQPVTRCSGGEQMRLAIARTLLRGAGVLLYDEPTTGLDPAAKAQVVRAISESHRRLSVIVTHDYAAFRDQVDTILFIDPASRQLRRMQPSSASFDTIGAALETTQVEDGQTRRRRTPVLSRIRHAWERFAIGVVDTFADAARLLLLPLAWLSFAHALHGPRLRKALRRDLAPSVFVFVAISAVLVSFTATYFIFERLPEREFTEPIVQDDLLAGIGLIATRIGVPLMIGVLLAAKLGAAAAAQLGHMSYTRQVDALRLMRVSPARHLLLPTASGQLASAILCTLVALALAYSTAMIVFLAEHPGWSVRYFHAAFIRELSWADAPWLFAKVGVSALGVALVAYRTGTSPKTEPGQVVRGIHKTLLRGLVLVLLVHAVFAFLEF